MKYLLIILSATALLLSPLSYAKAGGNGGGHGQGNSGFSHGFERGNKFEERRFSNENRRDRGHAYGHFKKRKKHSRNPNAATPAIPHRHGTPATPAVPGNPKARTKVLENR